MLYSPQFPVLLDCLPASPLQIRMIAICNGKNAGIKKTLRPDFRSETVQKQGLSGAKKYFASET
ncbi:hypothetical protein [Paraburkholderia tropica]|uniref:hypothetical protein n=1 Tax=Paraburkholderia tropica TaxID=92647 RepID=UPI002AB6D0E3|nr:hypothetical protein [Paraburkholderia tropica]